MRIQREALTTLVSAVMFRHGLSDEHAAIVAGVLVDTNLRGVDSHGVLRVPTYVDLLSRGETNPRPDIRLERSGWLLRVLADRGLGQIAGTVAIEAAIEQAREDGI